MPKQLLTNVRIVAGACDLTAVSNRVAFEPNAEVKVATTFGSVDGNGTLWQENMAGLGSASVAAGGFWEANGANLVDDDMWANFGGNGPWSFSGPAGWPTEGSLAYLANMVRTSYAVLGPVGEIAPYEASAVSSGPYARGATLLNPGTARTATGTGTIVNLGAVPAGRSMYAALHVLSVAGTTPSFTAVLQSAALVGFGSPTTRATFTAATARGSEWKASAGPTTDAFWRISYTISGTTPSFLVLATAGIG